MQCRDMKGLCSWRESLGETSTGGREREREREDCQADEADPVEIETAGI